MPCYQTEDILKNKLNLALIEGVGFSIYWLLIKKKNLYKYIYYINLIIILVEHLINICINLINYIQIFYSKKQINCIKKHNKDYIYNKNYFIYNK